MKLLCKQNYPLNCKGFFTPGKYYSVKKHPKLLSHFQIFDCFYEMLDDEGDGWIFTINKDYQYYIWDYFYTTKEIRKMKMQKINETTL